MASTVAAVPGAALAQVVDAIAGDGIAVVPGFAAPATIAGLRARVLGQDADGLLRDAGVGHGAARHRDGGVRGDRIVWLAESPESPIDASARALFEGLRLALNHELMLGLVDVEALYAIYPPGTGYVRHRDRFRDDDSRVISCVLYLNDQWLPGEGGALRFHIAGRAPRDVAPEGGTLVAFLAERHDHEVLPASRSRVSLAGWLRRRPLQRPVDAA
jgi:SM-20-related protein